MAQLTTNEQITKYETIVARKETILEEQEGYMEMEGQGSGATRVKYESSNVLEKQIEKYRNKIANLRLRSDATV